MTANWEGQFGNFSLGWWVKIQQAASWGILGNISLRSEAGAEALHDEGPPRNGLRQTARC